ncbi:MAG: arylsulfotransferase family protein [Candidatus Limnocylindrales bacterium]
MTNEHARPITRRRFLQAAGGVVLGGTAIGLLYEASGGAWPVSPRRPSPGMVAGNRSPAASPRPSPAARSFHTRPDLLAPVVTIDTPASAVAPGLVFLTPDNGANKGGPLILDNAGEPVWMLSVPGKSVTDFRVATYRGQPVLVWWEGSTNAGIGSGECVIADTSYREIARVQAASGRTIDLHEFQITPQGSAFFFADAAVPAALVVGSAAASSAVPAQVMDCAIQEVDIASGALLWEWHGVDHIALDESVVQPTKGDIYDSVHLNSIEVESDGTLLVSARNTSTIYKIDRQSGEIVWRLGGRHSDFSMGPGARFGYQHDARRQANGTLSLFDDETPPTPARGLVLRIDERAHTATLVRAYTRHAPNLVGSQGNMQVLANGNAFVGWGAAPYCSEFAPDGRLVFDATFPGAVQSYRDCRFEWVAEPLDDPAIALAATEAGTTVYASWNGATEIAGWEVLAGADAGHLQHVSSAARSGFETAMQVTTAQPLVAVRALDEGGRALGMSVPATLPVPSGAAG